MQGTRGGGPSRRRGMGREEAERRQRRVEARRVEGRRVEARWMEARAPGGFAG